MHKSTMIMMAELGAHAALMSRVTDAIKAGAQEQPVQTNAVDPATAEPPKSRQVRRAEERARAKRLHP
jgi:hypothetical protein